jgi:hypothetical protein
MATFGRAIKKVKTVEEKDKPRSSYKSAIVPLIAETIGFSPRGFNTLFHSPMDNDSRDPIHLDMKLLIKSGYMVQKFPIAFYDDVTDQLDKLILPLSLTLVIGVLEHLVSDMARALFIKSIIGRLNREQENEIILLTKSREQIKQKAERNNYPKDGDSYLISLPNGKQGRLKGIDQDELFAIAAYGRFEKSIMKTNRLSKIKDPHIILSNGF